MSPEKGPPEEPGVPENKIPLTGKQKAAVLMIALGTDKAAKIFRQLEDPEIERVTAAMAEMVDVSSEWQEAIFGEAVQMARSGQLGAIGGLDYARKVLEEAMGARRATDVISRVDLLMSKSASFEALDQIGATELEGVLAKEQPQTIALVLAHLQPYTAAQILSGLPEEAQTEVVMRIARMDKADPEVVSQIETVLAKQVTARHRFLRSVGGARTVASILNLVNRTAERNILEGLKEREWELAEEVKKLMFVFEDIVLIEDKSMQRVLKEVDINDITLALKAASDEVKKKVFDNLSKRATEMIREELEFMGPVRLKNVEDAQQRIVNTIRTLDEQGEILITGRGGEDEVLV